MRALSSPRWLLPGLLLAIACGSAGESLDAPRDMAAGDMAPPDAALDMSLEDAATDLGADDAGLPEGAVDTESGVVLGALEEDLVVHWAIPYAAPPVGALRFAPPAPVTRSPVPIPSDSPPPACPQRSRAGELIGAEDCLFLNVFSPRATAGPRPVMVWIHGGGFVQGSSNLALYDGRTLVRAGDVVVVSLNYRVGLAGFLTTPGLVAEGDAGNAGLRDQVAALGWVRRNIAAFGGDPDNVTLFGESAGGASICALLAAPAADELFVRGIIQSGGGCIAQPTLDGGARSRLSRDRAWVEALGCADDAEPAAELACLRGLSADRLVEVTAEGPRSGLGLPDVGPTLDGRFLVTDAATRLQTVDRPLSTGSNADESTTFVAAVSVPTARVFEALVRAQLGAVAEDVLALYPVGDFASPKAAYEAVVSDLSFICPALGFAAATAGGDAPAFTYHFTRALEGRLAERGAFHGIELFYLFGRFDQLGYPPRADDLALASAIQGAWTAFARGEDPTPGTTTWPRYDAEAASVLVLDVPPSVAETIREGRCEALRDAGALR